MLRDKRNQSLFLFILLPKRCSLDIKNWVTLSARFFAKGNLFLLAILLATWPRLDAYSQRQNYSISPSHTSNLSLHPSANNEIMNLFTNSSKCHKALYLKLVTKIIRDRPTTADENSNFAAKEPRRSSQRSNSYIICLTQPAEYPEFSTSLT